MYNITFFGVMNQVEKIIDKRESDPEAIRMFNDLVNYVEDCPFTKSKVTKFICKNWRLNPSQLTDKWNKLSVDKKANSTFRSQVSTASRLLYGIFGDINPTIFSDSERLSFDDKLTRDRLGLVLYSLDFEDVCVDGMFIQEISSFFEDLKTEREYYSLIELKDELELLKPLINTNIYEYLERGDADKLKYIFNVLNKPLTSVRNCSVNTDKLEILRCLGFLGSDYVGFNFREGGVSDRVVERVVEVPERHHYNLGITKKMAEALDKRLAENCTKEEQDRIGILRRSGKLEEIYERLHKRMNFVTEQGFIDVINKLNVLVLNDIINGAGDTSGVGFKK